MITEEWQNLIEKSSVCLFSLFINSLLKMHEKKWQEKWIFNARPFSIIKI